MKIFIVNTDDKQPTRYFRKLSTLARELGFSYSTMKKDFPTYKDESATQLATKRLKEGVVFEIQCVKVE